MNSDFRAQLLDLIDLISSPSQQLEYERNVPHADITNELICMWFDDMFHPTRNLVLDSFTNEEIEIMKEFHEFYDVRVDSLPDSRGTVTTWHKDKTWIEVMGKAKETKLKMTEQVGRHNVG